MVFSEDVENAGAEGLRRNRQVEQSDERAVTSAVPEQSARFDADLKEAELESLHTRVDLEKEELARLRQAHSQRRRFFIWATVVISAVLAASALFMMWYFIAHGSKTEPAVMIAWLTSALVETLGLGYIIANYLFDGGGNGGPKIRGRSVNGKAGGDS